MRPDGKTEGLRQSNAWLHTWTGLPLGWLLYAVFFTGTLSYFLDEVNVWMKPELHRSVPAADPVATAEVGINALTRLAPDATTWTLVMPGARQVAIEASWREPGAAQGRAGLKRAELDAATGEPIATRQTRGGSFLYRFHFELHAMPRIWGRWIVGIATGLMFVAILSGVITHRKIFSDFFTFRPNKGQRSWLDAHNATAVLALPFHVMITFSGLLLLMIMLMPWGLEAAYQGDTRAYATERRALGAGGGGGGGQPAAQGPQGGGARGPAALAPLAPMMAEAMARWPRDGVGTIVVNNPGTRRATVELREQTGHRLTDRGAIARLVFDGVTGTLREAPEPPRPTATTATYNVLTAPHLGRFAGPGFRWLLFLAGVFGTVMVATGLLLWVAKRMPERRKRGRTPFGHRLVEVLNLGTIGGLSVATAGYFWLNRLIPAEQIRRSDLEIQGFFVIWGVCLLHAAIRGSSRGWREQLAVAAILFAALPVLNPLTGGAGLHETLVRAQWPIAGFDLAMLALAIVHAAALFVLVRRAAPAPRRKFAADRAARAPKGSEPPAIDAAKDRQLGGAVALDSPRMPKRDSH
ncbi:MAG: PepSY-associated TM helix domain-containing protein [Lautropia sp.]